MKHNPRQKKLLTALEKRLEALTAGLESVEVQGKGIDLVKEIKELHHLLEALQGEKTSPEATAQPRVIVVWGEGALPSSSASVPSLGAGGMAGRQNRASASAGASVKSGARTGTKAGAKPPKAPKSPKVLAVTAIPAPAPVFSETSATSEEQPC